MNKKYGIWYALIIVALITVSSSCSKSKVEDRGLTETSLNAEFTVTPVSGNANKFQLIANDSSYIFSKWYLDNGAGAVPDRHSLQLFLPDAGTYNITHYAYGKGGASFAAKKTINVATSDPAAGNLVQGGKFETAADEAKWKKLIISSPAITWTMANGSMTATGGSWGHSAIYQAIEVQANKDYRFGMNVSGSGATDTWFEVYFGTDVPVQNTDYTSGGRQIGLSTWDGCGNTTFNGNLATIGCVGPLAGKSGVIRFTQSGTIYLVIKTGGANLGVSGISIDNVELRGM